MVSATERKQFSSSVRRSQAGPLFSRQTGNTLRSRRGDNASNARRTLFWSSSHEDTLEPVPPHIKLPSYATTGHVDACRDLCLHDGDELVEIRKAAQIASQALQFAEGLVEVGQTTEEIDRQIREFIFEQDAYPAPLNYAGFPKSSCISINEVVCHGIPGGLPSSDGKPGLGEVVEDGDIVSIDVSVFTKEGFFGDNCRTFLAGNVSDEDREFVEHARRAMWVGIRQCEPGRQFGSVGRAIAHYCNTHGLGSVERFCGHGVGRAMHMQPMVMHFNNDDSLPMHPGMTFTIEPMITQGQQDCTILEDGWTVVTNDGLRAAQFEHTVLITNDGCEVLTGYEGEERDYLRYH